jgi:hypothetical protein
MTALLIVLISCRWLPSFQYLEEDHRINRIDDSLQLFTAICSNKLLKDAQLILLLNKVEPLPFPLTRHSVTNICRPIS